MKKTTIVTLIVCIILSQFCMMPTFVFAETSGFCGAPDDSGTLGSSVSWSFADGTLTITGTGDMADFTSSTIPWKSFYSDITSVIISDGVTSIGDYAFDYHTSLQSVTLGKDIATIGSNAFQYCSKIQNVYITDLSAFCKITLAGSYSNPFGTASGSFLTPDTKNLYLNNAIVKNLVIPDGISDVSQYKFARCTSLETVTIPAGVKTIGANAFLNCSNITSIVMSDTVTSLGNYAFSNCSSLTGITIGSGVSSIGSNVFDGATALSAINVSSKSPYFYSLDGHLFDKDHTLLQYAPAAPAATYTLPVTTSKIKSYAFKGTVNLTHLIIPEGITTISENAFHSCTSMTQVTLPSTLTKIENHAFYNCGKLTEVVIPDSVTSLGTSTFYGCSNLLKATLSKNLTSLPYGLFSYCEKLTTTQIPEKVTYIDSYAFNKCKKLTNVTIPSKVTYIGLYAFYNCNAMTQINLPASIETIDFRAFEVMTSVTDIYYEGTSEEWDFIEINPTNAVLNSDSVTYHYNHNAAPLRHRIPKQTYDSATKTLSVTVVVRNNQAPGEASSSVFGLYDAAENLKQILYKDWGTLATGSTGLTTFTIENYTPAQGDMLKLFLWEGLASPDPRLPIAEAAVSTQ